MAYQTEPTFTHGTPAKTGILLINLGTPDEPTAQAVRPYLKEFLSDPRVVEIPKAIWWFILNGIILNVRPKKSAAKYATIWTKEGSPLRVHTEKQATLLQGYLGERTKAPFAVDYAMRYGNPSIPSALRKLREQNCQRILVVPMYPQYAASSTATAFDIVFDELRHSLNDRNDWMHALTDLVMDNLHGWLAEPDAAALEQSRLRALAMGAKN
ncbi:MAG: ferrochelatase [Nitrosomonadales bacterium]|nr:ferrochelatase [Nitrosomonadales bacterium]